MKKIYFIVLFLLSLFFQWRDSGVSVETHTPKALAWGVETDENGNVKCPYCNSYSCTCGYMNGGIIACRHCGAQLSSEGASCSACCGNTCGCCNVCGYDRCAGRCEYCGSYFCLGDCRCWCGQQKPCPYHSGGGNIYPPPSGGDPPGGTTPGGTGSTTTGGTGNNKLPKVSVPYTSTQYKNTGGYVSGSCDCKCIADKIMKQILGNNANIGSNGTRMQLWQEVNGVLTKVGNANDIFNTLNEHLDANRPITVGVDHTPNKHPGNSDLTTDHFIVITGRGYDQSKGQYYYNYIETGRGSGNGAGATSDNNRLYYDPSTGKFTNHDGYIGGDGYKLTQIRPNK